ncbi:MAG: hypothetical protein EXS37_11655 [Opitutus sp.]|nr:hypothetical protein [Opitutus sp.]
MQRPETVMAIFHDWKDDARLVERDMVDVIEHPIGDMVIAIKEAGIDGDTVVLITADHGGNGKKHGGNTMGELEIPWLITGPPIKRGFEITDPVNTFDTAATLAKLFGIVPPAAWIARPVESAFVKPVR